jgi:hypothetical protein
MTNGQEIIPRANMGIIEASGVNDLLSQIRPHWQGGFKSEVQRRIG